MVYYTIYTYSCTPQFSLSMCSEQCSVFHTQTVCITLCVYLSYGNGKFQLKYSDNEIHKLKFINANNQMISGMIFL